MLYDSVSVYVKLLNKKNLQKWKNNFFFFVSMSVEGSPVN